MIRVTDALNHLLISLTIIVVAIIIKHTNCAQAEDDLVVRAASRDVTLTGYTRSQTTMTLSSEVSGRVLKINYDDGQRYEKMI